VPAPPVPGPTRAAHDLRDQRWRWPARLGRPTCRSRLVFGPEPWRELAGGTWSPWDLWFCTLAVTGFDGDWARLGDEIVRRSPRYLVGLDWEAKLSHLEDLPARLAAADLDAAELAGEAAHDEKVVTRARRKVLDQPLQGGRDLTPAMRATRASACGPRHTGHWDRFPVSPAAAHDEFAETVKRVRARGRGAWGIVQALQRRLHDQDRRARNDPARRLALRRGLLTAGIKALGEVRDSDWELAGFLRRVAGHPRAAAVAAQRDRRTGVLHPPVRAVRVGEPRPALPAGDRPVRQRRRRARDLVEALLWSLAAELRRHRLGHPAEVAMALVAYLQAATGRLDRLVATAERLGSDQWMPVVALARPSWPPGGATSRSRCSPPPTTPDSSRPTSPRRSLELTGQPPPRRHLRAVR
jgi:hypothetical protein